jgi:hypothetical protein
MGAAGLPFLIGRLKRNHRITPGIADPAEGLALLYTDSILHDPRVLRFVIETIGADRVMLGSDCRSRSGSGGLDQRRACGKAVPARMTHGSRYRKATRDTSLSKDNRTTWQDPCLKASRARRVLSVRGYGADSPLSCCYTAGGYCHELN